LTSFLHSFLLFYKDSKVRATHFALAAFDAIVLFTSDDGNFFKLGYFQDLLGAEVYADAATLAPV
jgi:hypothetical protein